MCPIPVVVTIHDLAYYYYPDEFLKKDLYKLRHWTAYAVSKARKIIAVSKTTKKDIIRHFNLSDEMVDVIYNGYEKEIREEAIITNIFLGSIMLLTALVMVSVAYLTFIK